jgi:hypothetical protein
MTLKSYLLGMKIGAVLAFSAWLLILTNFDPIESGMFGKILFYGSLLLSLSAIFILILTWLRKKATVGEEIAFAYVGASFRQGVLLALLTVILLILQSMRVLVWWDGLLVTAGVFLMELYFLTRR